LSRDRARDRARASSGEPTVPRTPPGSFLAARAREEAGLGRNLRLAVSSRCGSTLPGRPRSAALTDEGPPGFCGDFLSLSLSLGILNVTKPDPGALCSRPLQHA
jgi:hypothetical protein